MYYYYLPLTANFPDEAEVLMIRGSEFGYNNMCFIENSLLCYFAF